MQLKRSVRSKMKAAKQAVDRSSSHLALYSGLYRLAGTVYGGIGTIFCLHRVAGPERQILNPGYMVAAEALDGLLARVRSLGWEIVGIDEVHRRLTQHSFGRRFVCFTFDDGYADNLTIALPIFRKHQAPFSVNIATGLLDRSLFYWWGALEELVIRADTIDIPETSVSCGRKLTTRSRIEKQVALDTLDGLCHRLSDAFFPVVCDLFTQHEVRPEDLLDRDAMTLDQARRLVDDPLVTPGAHGITHRRLIHMTEAEARDEIEGGRRRLEKELGTEVRHMAYPFGGRSACTSREFAMAKAAGYKTAVTTRQGNLFPGHTEHCECLPRRGVPLDDLQLRNCLYGVETVFKKQPIVQTD